MNKKCYQEELTETLFVYIFSSFAVNRQCAHNWVRATFKPLAGGSLGIWSLVDIIFWIFGGVHIILVCSTKVGLCINM